MCAGVSSARSRRSARKSGDGRQRLYTSRTSSGISTSGSVATSCWISPIGKIGVRSGGPAGSCVAGLSGGLGSPGRSGIRLTQCVGISDSGSMYLTASSLTAAPPPGAWRFYGSQACAPERRALGSPTRICRTGEGNGNETVNFELSRGAGGVRSGGGRARGARGEAQADDRRVRLRRQGEPCAPLRQEGVRLPQEPRQARPLPRRL